MNNLYKGVYLAFATAFISGFAVFFNKFAIGFWQSSSVFTTAKNIVAALLLVSAVLFFKKLPELKKLSKKSWLKLVLIGFIGGSVPFLLFFKGLYLTSAVNAAFIHKTLFIWVAFLAVPLLKEKISALQFLSLGMLVLGVFLFIKPTGLKIGLGEVLVFSATLLWATENIIAKVALKKITPVLVAWGRMFFGSVFLLIFLLLSGGISGLVVGSFAQVGWLLLGGLILFGYVTTWYTSLKYAPVTVVSAVLVVAAPITALINAKEILFVPAAMIVLGALGFSKLIEKFYNSIKRRKFVWMGS